jgi:protein TonB
MRVVRHPPAAEKPVFDTRNDVAPPTFFPGGYDSDEGEGGGKTKALVIIAAVVLLACSAGYLSWKNMGSKNAAAASTAASGAASSATSATPSAETTNSRESAAPAQAATEEITLGNSAPSAPAPKSATKPSATKEVAPKEVASKEAAPEPEPEVTQRLIVRNDTRHLEPTTKPQEAESVQAPSAIGLGGEADTKALANISSAPVNVPKPSAQLLRVSQGVMEGLVLKRVQPRYPPQAMQLRIQGSVQLQATIGKSGDIENLKVVSGDAILARAAQEAVKQWKYKPYYLNGDPVPIQTQILVNFKLPN